LTHPSILTLRTLAMETWHEVTNLDSKGGARWRDLPSPDDAVSGLNPSFLRATVQRQIASWVTFLRFLTPAPVGLAMEAVAPRGATVGSGTGGPAPCTL